MESSKLRFENHSLFRYFEEISDDIPLFLYRYAVDYFGKHSWYNVPTALKAVQTSNLDDDTKELVSAYIEAQDEPELTDKIHHKKKIAKALKKLEINDVIIPCRILNDRQCSRFPCVSLCTRIQGLWANKKWSMQWSAKIRQDHKNGVDFQC